MYRMTCIDIVLWSYVSDTIGMRNGVVGEVGVTVAVTMWRNSSAMVNTSDSSMQSIALRFWDSPKCLMRDLAMAGDCEGVLDFVKNFEDHGCVGNTGDSSVVADVSRDEFEGYDYDGTGSGGFFVFMR